VGGIVLVWSACVGAPAIQLFRRARALPLVQRARLKALSYGYGGLIVVVFVAVFGGGARHPSVELGTQLGALAFIPFLLLSFAPPAWLRRAWREKEEERIGLVEDLATFSPDRLELARRIVNSAVRMVGASGGLLCTDSGEVIAAEGLDEDAATRLASEGAPSHTPFPLAGNRRRLAIVTEVPAREHTYLLGVLSGSLTPLFGSEEVARLVDFGSLAGVALDRADLVEELRDETGRYQSLLQAVSDLGEGFLITEGGRCVYANEAYCRMTGYTLEELQAMESLLLLSHPDDRGALAEGLRVRLAGGEVPEHFETRFVRRDGRVVECEVAVKLYETGEGVRLISIVRDIDERKRMERFRDEFIANAAHELRTPVTAIMGFATLITDRPKLSPEKTQQALDGMKRQSERLRRLVADLLDLSSLQRGRRELAPKQIAIADLAEGLLQGTPPPETKRVRLEVPDGLVVFADPSGLDDALTNLLINAYRYGGDEIVIEARGEDGTAVVSVSDDGPGIPIEYHEIIFHKFRQVKSAHLPRVRSSGLGLAFCKLAVEAHGGRIWVKSREGEGSTFYVTLPARI
jgi:PAS domain S-box-containing protein